MCVWGGGVGERGGKGGFYFKIHFMPFEKFPLKSSEDTAHSIEFDIDGQT